MLRSRLLALGDAPVHPNPRLYYMYIECFLFAYIFAFSCHASYLYVLCVDFYVLYVFFMPHFILYFTVHDVKQFA